MKIRQNLFLKILAFLLALVFFAAAAAMAIYQVAHFPVLWEEIDPFYGYVCAQMYREDRENIQELIELSGATSLNMYSQQRLEDLQEALDAEHTNLRWQVNYEGKTLYGNAEHMPDRVAFYVYDVQVRFAGIPVEGELLVWLDPDLPVADDYRMAVRELTQWKHHRVETAAATAVCALLGILCTIYLCVTCGHKKGREGIYLNWVHHIPGDLFLAVSVIGVALCMMGIVESFDYYTGLEFHWSLILATLCVTGIALLVISFFVTFVARCKGRKLLRYTVIGWLCRKLWSLCKKMWWLCAAAAQVIPLIGRTAAFCTAYLLFTLILLGCATSNWVSPFWLVLWVLVTLAALLYLCWWALEWKRVRQGACEIISGNTGYQIDSSRMPSDLRGHAEELNNLGQAIGAAVEERMKSERFRAELITNVSHDLKTPLTSIISYVDLLKKEELDDPKVQEYIEVLDRKSQRLKKLTEDLVEASKASTGALNVNRERLDLVQLVDQALGEYEQRLNAQGLMVVRTLPAYPVWVVADGRHVWRILDNLLSNCAKYALEGTRVYLEVQPIADRIKLTVKNISRDELNIPAERLTERFVRGDESRTLEGSGLGLSIAQSLAELQDGTFEVDIDGDLFKAVLTLPPAPPVELL